MISTCGTCEGAVPLDEGMCEACWERFERTEAATGEAKAAFRRLAAGMVRRWTRCGMSREMVANALPAAFEDLAGDISLTSPIRGIGVRQQTRAGGCFGYALMVLTRLRR